jgi:hypothetical protein
VTSWAGDSWNVTVTPDGTFDTFSLHHSRKKFGLLVAVLLLVSAVLSALAFAPSHLVIQAVAAIVTTVLRKRLPLRQRWYT